MDVAAIEAPASAYIFFYTYRLSITMALLPLLMSFVIRSFIALNDFLSADKVLEAQLQIEVRLLHFHICAL